jgi:hypothetical protein
MMENMMPVFSAALSFVREPCESYALPLYSEGRKGQIDEEVQKDRVTGARRQAERLLRFKVHRSSAANPSSISLTQEGGLGGVDKAPALYRLASCASKCRVQHGTIAPVRKADFLGSAPACSFT